MSESFSNVLWDVGYDLFWEIKEKWFDKRKCIGAKPAPLTTYNELRAAFLPTRTKQSVERACDKIAKSAELMFANSELLSYEAEPSCSALGLDEKSDVEDKIYNRCHFASSNEKPLQPPILVCDCPDGYAEYTPHDYAKEHLLKCYSDTLHLHYSDYPEALAKGYRHYISAKEEGDVSGMVIGCDTMINAVHGSGPLATFFVEGGRETLNKLAEAKE